MININTSDTAKTGSESKLENPLPISTLPNNKKINNVNDNKLRLKRHIVPVTPQFFSNLFALEMQFRFTLDGSLVPKIINEYANAVEYYSSVNDKRKMNLFNMRINKFIEDNEVQMALNKEGEGIKTKGQQNLHMKKEEIKRKLDFLERIDLEDETKQRKKDIKNILDEEEESITDDSVENNIDNKCINANNIENINNKHNHVKNSGKKHSVYQLKRKATLSKMNNEIAKQKLSFKAKLKQKRTLKKTLNLNEYIHSTSTQMTSNGLDEALKKNCDTYDNNLGTNEKDNNIDEKEISEFYDGNNVINSNKKPINLDEKNISELSPITTKFESTSKKQIENDTTLKIIGNIENVEVNVKCFDENDKDEEKIISKHDTPLKNIMTNKSVEINTDHNFLEDNNKNNILFMTHKKGLEEIKNVLEEHINSFSEYYYDELFVSFMQKINSLILEKFDKYVETSRDFAESHKKLETKISDLKSEIENKGENEEIKEKIKENEFNCLLLDEEKDNVLEQLNEVYAKKIKESEEEFKNYNFKNDPGMQLMEEKFILNMCNKINQLID